MLADIVVAADVILDPTCVEGSGLNPLKKLAIEQGRQRNR
jgi:hypothetical protein